MLRASVQPHHEWLRTNMRREKIRHAWAAFFTEWDILIAPQLSTPAFCHDHGPIKDRVIEIDGRERPFFEQLFWPGLAVNAYLPSTVFPVTRSSQGLPIGVQAMCGNYQDHRTIEFARLVTEKLGGFVPPENYV